MELQTQQSQPQPQQTAPPATAKSDSAPRGHNRCRRRTRANGRCRLPVHDPATGLCFKHAAAHEDTDPDSADLSADLFRNATPSFDSVEEINSVLTNLVVLVAQGRISSRRAGVITYALSFILRGLQAIDKKAADEPIQIICDIDSAVARRAKQAAQELAQSQNPTHDQVFSSPVFSSNDQEALREPAGKRV